MAYKLFTDPSNPCPTCGLYQGPEESAITTPCACACHKVGVLGFYCCPCSSQAIAAYLEKLRSTQRITAIPSCSADGKLRSHDLVTGKKMQEVDEFTEGN